MSVRRLPFRPDLEQIKRQAKELLRAIHHGDASAIAELHEHHPAAIDPPSAKLADAQLVLARTYQASSWTRLVHAVRLADAIWRDDIDTVRALVSDNTALIHEHVLVRSDSNWGPPMTYAANLGRDGIIRMLHEMGASDLESAGGRAALQGKPDTVRMIYDLAGRPPIEGWSLAGPAYTLNVEGTAILLALGARIVQDGGVDLNAMENLLGTDSRNPPAKHRILQMYPEHGLARDPDLFTRTFDIAEIFPMAPACACDPHTAQGTPVHGTTLLHLAAYFDELEIGEWLLDRGMDPDARAATDADEFGGYTALFSTVVSQHNFWVNYGKGQPDDAFFPRLLLDRGADPTIRVSLRARLEEGHGGGSLDRISSIARLPGRRRWLRIDRCAVRSNER